MRAVVNLTSVAESRKKVESEREAGLVACVVLLDPELNCGESRRMFIACEVLHSATHRASRPMRGPHSAIKLLE